MTHPKKWWNSSFIWKEKKTPNADDMRWWQVVTLFAFPLVEVLSSYVSKIYSFGHYFTYDILINKNNNILLNRIF